MVSSNLVTVSEAAKISGVKAKDLIDKALRGELQTYVSIKSADVYSAITKFANGQPSYTYFPVVYVPVKIPFAVAVGLTKDDLENILRDVFVDCSFFQSVLIEEGNKLERFECLNRNFLPASRELGFICHANEALHNGAINSGKESDERYGRFKKLIGGVIRDIELQLNSAGLCPAGQKIEDIFNGYELPYMANGFDVDEFLSAESIDDYVRLRKEIETDSRKSNPRIPKNRNERRSWLPLKDDFKSRVVFEHRVCIYQNMSDAISTGDGKVVVEKPREIEIRKEDLRFLISDMAELNNETLRQDKKGIVREKEDFRFEHKFNVAEGYAEFWFLEELEKVLSNNGAEKAMLEIRGSSLLDVVTISILGWLYIDNGEKLNTDKVGNWLRSVQDIAETPAYVLAAQLGKTKNKSNNKKLVKKSGDADPWKNSRAYYLIEGCVRYLFATDSSGNKGRPQDTLDIWLEKWCSNKNARPTIRSLYQDLGC